jgi:general secretion pathway protein G
MKRPQPSARCAGFTLIELVVTVAILAVLASAALPLTQLTVQRAKENELRSALRQIRDAIDAFKQASDDGRIARRSDHSGYPPNLTVLVEGVRDARAPQEQQIYFLRRLPRDPFAAAALAPEETWGRRSYDSPVNAPREGDDVYDVYSRAEGSGINGIPYRQW